MHVAVSFNLGLVECHKADTNRPKTSIDFCFLRCIFMTGHRCCSTVDRNIIFQMPCLANFSSSTFVTKVFRTENTKITRSKPVICICKLHVLQLQNKFL